MDKERYKSLTRANVIQLGIFVFLLGGLCYGSLLLFGFDNSTAGIASEALLVLIVLAWSGSYFYRVLTGNMTFMEQRKRYRNQFERFSENKLQEKFDSLTEQEKINLLESLKNDKK